MKCSASFIREMHVKMTLRFPLTPIRMTKKKLQVTSYPGKDLEKREYSASVLAEVQTWAATLEINIAVSQEMENWSTSIISFTTSGSIPRDGSLYHKDSSSMF